MYADAKQLVKIFSASLSTILDKEREGKFPQHHKMVRIEQGTTDKKVWRMSTINNFIESIIYLYNSNLTVKEIAEKGGTTPYFVNSALDTRNRSSSDMDIFHLVLQISARLTNNRGI